ncbi:hypothetical protein D3C72_1515860 [compost metagenome]
MLRRAPAGLGHGGQAREQVVLQTRVSARVLGEHVRLQAKDVPALVGGQFGRHRFVVVELGQVHLRRPARRFVRRGRLQVIQVQMADRRHHHIVAGAGRSKAAFGTAPGHYRGLRRQAALKDFVPADQAAVVLFQEGFQALDDVALHGHLILDAERAHALLHLL